MTHHHHRPTRRETLALLSAGLAASIAGPAQSAEARMPTRAMPKGGEPLPVIGLGSSKAVAQIPTAGPGPLAEVLQTLADHGGSVVDTWPRNPANDAAFGEIINAPALRDKLFIATKIDRTGKDAGIAQYRDSLKNYGREIIDLAQIFSLTDLDTHWPSLKDWKAEGSARHIGVTVSNEDLYEKLEGFLGRESPDTMQINYSITERNAESRLLPLAADKGVAVIVNRPFMNGDYFQRLAGRALPPWAAEIGCESWAQFSLKYILSHPHVTCVLTETTNPRHMAENARAALGPLPDETLRARMRGYIDQA